MRFPADTKLTFGEAMAKLRKEGAQDQEQDAFEGKMRTKFTAALSAAGLYFDESCWVVSTTVEGEIVIEGRLSLIEDEDEQSQEPDEDENLPCFSVDEDEE